MSTEATKNDSVAPIELGSLTNHFGVCPTCRRQDGCHSIGPDHWYVCNAHKVKWNVGSNLFSTWRHLTPEQHRANADKLAGYRKVEPFSLLEHGTAEEVAAYHACVAEVGRIAANAGFTVDISPHRYIVDPRELEEDARERAERAAMADDDDIPF